jgi:hypothetical protein
MLCDLPSLLRRCLCFAIVDDLASMVFLFALLSRKDVPWHSIPLGETIYLVCVHLARIAFFVNVQVHPLDTDLSDHVWDRASLRRLLMVLSAVLPTAFIMGFSLDIPCQFLILVIKTVPCTILWFVFYFSLLWRIDKGLVKDSNSRVREEANARLEQLTLRKLTAAEVDPEVGDGRRCFICLSEFNAEEELLKLNCGHTYHELCIKHWFLRGGRGCALRCHAISAIV